MPASIEAGLVLWKHHSQLVPAFLQDFWLLSRHELGDERRLVLRLLQDRDEGRGDRDPRYGALRARGSPTVDSLGVPSVLDEGFVGGVGGTAHPAAGDEG
jgi:hypothetical protein